MRNLTLFSTWYTSLHVCVALAHDPRYVPRLVLSATLPGRGSLRSSPQPVFLASSCLRLAVLMYRLSVRSFPLWLLFLTRCRSALLTSCRSALLSLAVGPLFPFFSVSTASTATSLTSPTASHGSCPSPSRLLQRDIAFSSSSLAVIMALHEPPAMALHGSPASLHASPCFRRAVKPSTC